MGKIILGKLPGEPSGEPSYPFSTLSLAPKSRELHSSGFHLSVPRIKTDTDSHAFSVSVPTLWNSLSEHVKPSNSIVSFRQHWKTHHFRLAYPSQVYTFDDIGTIEMLLLI